MSGSDTRPLAAPLKCDRTQQHERKAERGGDDEEEVEDEDRKKEELEEEDEYSLGCSGQGPIGHTI
jgi:hypothetical protein